MKRRAPADSQRPTVLIEPWSDGDLALLRRINAPEMMGYLGGPESDEEILVRHARYLASNDSASRMFRIVLLPQRDAAGSVGYWEKAWRGESVYETGWSVLPQFQGRGVAVAAADLAIARARAQKSHRYVHAFPSGDNAASNAVCRKLGFQLLSECDFEYPPGHPIRCNDWRLDIGA